VYSRRRDHDTLRNLGGAHRKKRYPYLLGRIRFCDPETNRILVFLGNNIDFDALTICYLCTSRWRAEFFQQHLRIKRFFGAAETPSSSRKRHGPGPRSP